MDACVQVGKRQNSNRLETRVRAGRKEETTKRARRKRKFVFVCSRAAKGQISALRISAAANQAEGRQSWSPLGPSAEWCLASEPAMAAHSERIQGREKMSKELLEVMAGGRAVGVLKHNLAKQEQMLDKLLDTQKTAAQLIKELMTAEEMVAQKLSDREEELKASFQKLQKIEQSLLQASEEDTQMRTHTKERAGGVERRNQAAGEECRGRCLCFQVGYVSGPPLLPDLPHRLGLFL
ncbi:kinetochore protein Spc24 isoform X1 [Hemicordylus capensis]|uniref:kinetochore protein Spc24 isoform X1 n=1 Tax=Hemicordylus capensis TaxID=884348 RepID=UPI002303D8C2|nr:kinetochore protein Spc24 isoform X1 [Hemicordylus capensis]